MLILIVNKINKKPILLYKHYIMMKLKQQSAKDDSLK